MRSMANIVTVKETFPLVGKDKIHLASFKENSFTAIVPKAITENTLMVWIEADSILPEKPQWEFLRKRCWNDRLQGFLIKPMKMGEKEDGTKTVSWGLCITPEEAVITRKVKAGDDVEKELEIRKYEPDSESLRSNECSKIQGRYPKWVKALLKFSLTRRFTKAIIFRYEKKLKEKFEHESAFPSDLISKSDEDRLENFRDAEKFLRENKDTYVDIAAKMEGQSVTALLDYDRKKHKIGKMYVCSRSLAYRKDNNNTFWQTAKKYNMEEKLLKYYNQTGKILIIQAEQCGPSIQSNIYQLKEVEWFVYKMKEYDPKTETTKQLSTAQILEICKDFELRSVPYIVLNEKLGDVFNFENAQESVVELCKTWEEKTATYKNTSKGESWTYKAKDKEELWKDFMHHEGIVVKSANHDKDAHIGFSFKIKSDAYALKGLADQAKINAKLLKA